MIRPAGRALSLLFAVAVVAGCGGSSGGSSQPQQSAVARVDVAIASSGATANLVAGSTLSLAATVFDANNAVVRGAPVAWSSSDANVATVVTAASGTGLVTGSHAGTANITATSGNVTSAPFLVTVQARPASGAHVYFLQFEGQTLTPGVDNPPANVSQLVSTTTTVPRYLANDPQRASKIQAIVSEVSVILAPYDISIVTARPATGTYDMAVAGGQPSSAGLPAGVLGAAPTDCGTTGHHVSLLFDTATGHDAARQIVTALGETHAVPSSTVSGDCMCDASGFRTGLAAACTIGGPGTPVSQSSTCATGPTMDERSLFLAAFGAHP